MTDNVFQEQIELDMLQRQGNNEKERAKSQQVRYDDLHVLVLVKAPLLALRYQLPDGQVCSSFIFTIRS